MRTLVVNPQELHHFGAEDYGQPVMGRDEFEYRFPEHVLKDVLMTRYQRRNLTTGTAVDGGMPSWEDVKKRRGMQMLGRNEHMDLIIDLAHQLN